MEVEDNYQKSIKEYALKPFPNSEIIESDNILSINKSYMLLLNSYEIFIYDFTSNSFFDKSIILKSFRFADFHCSDENIFFVCEEKVLVIYRIIDKTINQISMIKGFSDDLSYASFNPFDINIILSISLDGIIKIYNITKPIPLNYIYFQELVKKNQNMIVRWGKNKLGFIKANKIIYFDYKSFDRREIDKISTKNRRPINFYFINNDENLIVITRNTLEITKNKAIYSTYFLNQSIEKTFLYDEKGLLIYITYNIIKGVSFSEDLNIKTIFEINEKLIYHIDTKIFFISEAFMEQNEFCKLFVKDDEQTFCYSILNNNKNNNGDNNMILDENNYHLNYEIIRANFCDIPLIISYKNNEERIDFGITKKYLKIKEINDELKEIKRKSLFKRKELVEKEILNFEKIEDIKDRYIFLVKLLINDNTNTILLKKYLEFLKAKQNDLKELFNNNIESYEDELNYYSKALSPEDILDISSKILDISSKTKDSQKILFIEMLKTLKNINEIKEFEKILIESEKYIMNINYFNMFIDFKNEELFYHRNYNLINYYLRSIYKNLKGDFEIIKSKNIEKNQGNITTKNKDKIKSQLNEIKDKINICFNFLEKDAKDVDLINKVIISFVLSGKDEFESIFNFLTNLKGNIESLKKQNDKYLKEFFNGSEYVNIDINSIKKFYKKILPSNCFKSIYLTLYGENEYYPFSDESFTESFVEEFFEIINIPFSSYLAVTDKFTMKTYFVPFLSNFFIKCSDEEKNALRCSMVVRAGNHEIGHNFVNIMRFLENGQLPLDTPRKKNLDFEEGGFYVDLALFGRIINEINLEEALYILNEKNYDKDFSEFEKGFNNIKKEDLIVKGTFENICANIKLDNKIDNSKLKIIPAITYGKYKKVSLGIKNDVIGKFYPDNYYNELLKKYS